MHQLYDLVIIGSGPAGLSAAIYAQRAELNTIIIERSVMSGGQIVNTYEVDNYPGLPGINGFDMAMKFREHAEKLGANFIEDEVIRIEDVENKKRVICGKETYETKTVFIASGAAHRTLDVPGEVEFSGKGVSYCATCDGAFFRGKETAVVGGGDVAVEDAIFLARICKKVYLIHRRDELRAAKSLQAQLFACENVEFIWDSTVTSIEGSETVEKLKLLNIKTEEKSEIAVSGIFIAVGIIPNSEIYKDYLELDKQGYIIADEDTVTSKQGVFAGGDVRTKQLRQIVTAVSDGANAVTSVERYMNEVKL